MACRCGLRDAGTTFDLITALRRSGPRQCSAYRGHGDYGNPQQGRTKTMLRIEGWSRKRKSPSSGYSLDFKRQSVAIDEVARRIVASVAAKLLGFVARSRRRMLTDRPPTASSPADTARRWAPGMESALGKLRKLTNPSAPDRSVVHTGSSAAHLSTGVHRSSRRPSPRLCLRPHRRKRRSRWFVQSLPGCAKLYRLHSTLDTT